MEMHPNLVTGYWGEDHIYPSQLGQMQADIVGEGCYITSAGNGLTAKAISANDIQIATGGLFVQGRYLLNEQPQIVQISNGSQLLDRHDLICVRYTMAENSPMVEKTEWVVVEGTPSAAPTDPDIVSGKINDGAVEHLEPIFRVQLQGLTVKSVTTIPKKMSDLAAQKAAWDSVSQRLWEGSWSSGSIDVPGLSEYDHFVVHVAPDVSPTGDATAGIRCSRGVKGGTAPIRGIGGMTTATEMRIVGCDLRPSGDSLSITTLNMFRVYSGGAITVYSDRVIRAIDGIL